MVYGARDFAGVPLYWAVARLIGRGGMSAVTVRAAAAEAGCSVGFMRHYYDNKTLMLACAFELIADEQLRRLEEVLWARREPLFNPVPPEQLGPGPAAELLVSCLNLGVDTFLVSVQSSYLELARHDAAIGGAVSSYHGRLREDCMKVLREAGVPRCALEQEAIDLWVLLIGLMALVPGLAAEDPDDPDDPDDPEARGDRTAGLAMPQVEAIVRRHLEAAVARHGGAEADVLDEAG